MSRYHSYLNSAVQILKQYNGQEPFASFLKKYYSANKKFGSKDRKQVSNLCYCFFRLGKAVMNISLEEKILTALFLCSTKSNDVLNALKPEWDEKTGSGIEEKSSILNAQFSIFNIFPWNDELSAGIDHEKFCESFLIQPDLFLRLRPGNENTVKQKLMQAGITFESITDSCLALPNSSKIEGVIELDKEAVIQDYNSQQVCRFIKSEIENLKSTISLWDCCAGSGGKSIMAYDMNPKTELTVSDMRESIISNLKKRFLNAGIKKYNAAILDLTQKNIQHSIFNIQYSTVLADVPCTGSGTWSRTPEQLYFFDKKKIEEYSNVQKKIVSNAIPHLQPGGSFIYITCSVFKKENEDMVDFIKEKHQLELKTMKLLKGYDQKADSMFVAVLQKSL